jgi:predicted amidohydrolase YtcJ
VLRGGKVVTVDGSDTIAEAVAVVGNRIAAVGSTEAIEAYIGPGTRIVELNGRTLLPGFIDAHNHVEGSAAGQFFRLPVSVPPLETAEDVLKKVQQRASELPPGTWIEGQGTYYQPMPTREQLDTAIPDHPVVIRWSAHDVIANSKAMEMSRWRCPGSIAIHRILPAGTSSADRMANRPASFATRGNYSIFHNRPTRTSCVPSR